MMMRPGDILGRIFYVVTEINHRNLSTEHTEDTDRRKLSTELFWKLLRKKSLEEIFVKIWPEARNNLPLSLHKYNL